MSNGASVARADPCMYLWFVNFNKKRFEEAQCAKG